MRGLNDKQLFDDVARLATGAVGALSGFRQHLRQEIKTQLDRFLIELDLVPRSDFEIVEQMTKQARLDNESLKKRLADLEAKLGGVKIAAAPVKKSTSSAVKAKTKPAAKKAPAKKPVKKGSSK